MKLNVIILAVLFVVLNSCGSKSSNEITEEKIKSDLIGTSIGTWNFDSPSEFVDFRINSRNESEDLLEFDAEFILEGYDTKEVFYLHALLVYKKENGEWKYVQGNKLEYIRNYEYMELD